MYRCIAVHVLKGTYTSAVKDSLYLLAQKAQPLADRDLGFAHSNYATEVKIISAKGWGIVC